MKKHPTFTIVADSKRAFTLIEILVVISILIILMGITSQMIGSVGDAQGRARAQTDLELIGTGVEAFMGKYGGYPRISCSSNEKTAAGDLYKCLIGKMALSVKNGEIYMDDLSAKPRKPFIDATLIKICDPDDADLDDVDYEKAGVYFADPWREPYLYFYNTSKVIGVVDGVWRSPGYIIMSKGPDQKHIEVKNMYSSGIVPDEVDYTEKDENVDNLIRGRTK